MRRVNRMKIYLGVLFKGIIHIIFKQKGLQVRKEEYSIKYVTILVRITRLILLLFSTVENMMTVRWFLHS
jgi:hypothetical protein